MAARVLSLAALLLAGCFDPVAVTRIARAAERVANNTEAAPYNVDERIPQRYDAGGGVVCWTFGRDGISCVAPDGD